MIDALAFEKWLVGCGYRSSTARRTAQEVRRTFYEYEDDGKLGRLDPNRRTSLCRFLAFVASTAGVIDGRFMHELERAGLSALAPRPMVRRNKTDRRSFGDDDWVTLSQILAVDRAPEGLALYAIACSSLRIGEVLSLSIEQIDTALDSLVLRLERKGGHMASIPIGGAIEPWQRISSAFDRSYRTIAEWLTSTPGASPLAGDAAYQRVNRHLKALSRKAGLRGRIHLHRLRRTVAVQALRLTKDIRLVGDLLGHEAIESTEHYVDELRERDVEQLQHELRRFRSK